MKEMNTNIKIIFILTVTSLTFINPSYAIYAESIDQLRTPLNTIEAQRWQSASDEIAKNGIEPRTKDRVALDRVRLKELLDQGPRTVKELSKLTGQPEHIVRNDIAGTPLRNHPNLVARRRMTRYEVLSRRARLEKLLEQGEGTVKGLAKLTRSSESSVRYDINRTPKLRNHFIVTRQQLRESAKKVKDFRKYSLEIDGFSMREMQKIVSDSLNLLNEQYYFLLLHSKPIFYKFDPLDILIINITNQHGQNIEIKLEIVDTPHMFNCKDYTELVRVFPTGFKDRYSVLIQRCVFEMGEESQTKALSTALVKYGLDVVFALSAGYSLEEAIATAKDIQEDLVERFLEPRFGISFFESLKIEDFDRITLIKELIYNMINRREGIILFLSAFEGYTDVGIAKLFGLSNERIRQIRGDICSRLKRYASVTEFSLLPHFIRHWEARTLPKYYTQEDITRILIEADNEMNGLSREIGLESAEMHRDDI